MPEEHSCDGGDAECFGEDGLVECSDNKLDEVEDLAVDFDVALDEFLC